MKKTIFVVDDNDTNLIMAKEALTDEFRVMTLPSAEKLFVFIEKLMPDLILLDIEMPEMNGFEALRKLKDSPDYKHIPVVFLTGTLDDESEAEGRRLGALDFVVKPFTVAGLIETVKKHLGD